MLAQLFRTKAEENSKLSEFVRTASSRQKKRVYIHVIEKAIASQNEVINRQLATKR